MDEESIPENTQSDKDAVATSFDELSVDDVDGIMSNTENGTSDHPDAHNIILKL